MNFAKFLREPFLQNTSGRLLLNFALTSTLSLTFIVSIEILVTTFVLHLCFYVSSYLLIWFCPPELLSYKLNIFLSGSFSFAFTWLTYLFGLFSLVVWFSFTWFSSNFSMNFYSHSSYGVVFSFSSLVPMRFPHLVFTGLSLDRARRLIAICSLFCRPEGVKNKKTRLDLVNIINK